MDFIRPSIELVKDIQTSETEYMVDRMLAIQERENNPEGVELQQFGNACCIFSKTMPWPAFNTVKGITSEDIAYLDQIINFYRTRDRKAQFEIVPSLTDQELLSNLANRGFYQSGFHTSLYTEPSSCKLDKKVHIRINELQEDQFELYATIHCRGTGLSDQGISSVAANNKVLYSRPGWKYYIAYLGEEPAAVAVMYMHKGIASLTFAATLPQYRNKGLQSSLLQRRMDDAQQNNCRLLVGQCSFLSQSHRNMERIGMKVGYIRTTWTER